ncbi:MAG: PAS domain S-box protein, partial [Methanomassiliicoccales archaeon]|nr:PAS domain S-box protein [Methanomassiliicoccales archaeon]
MTPSSPIHILVVDDEPALLEVSKEFLEMDHDISVDTTTSTKNALELIGLHEYDVIVSDYQMPGKDGIQLLKEVRASGNKIPFILFTGKGREEVVIDALNAGADYYLQKGGHPTSQFAELTNMIKQAHAKEQKELALRISEERYRSLFENSVDAVMLTTIDFERILFANPSACSMFGMSEEDIKKIGIKSLITDDNAWEDVLQRLNQTGIVKGEFTYKRKDGTTFTGETTHGILTGQYGLARISMIVRDVTERQLADTVLRGSEARLHTYMDNAPEGIFIADARGNYQDVNRTACEMLKYSREELLDLNIADISDESTLQESRVKFQELQEKGSMTQETVLIRKDGTKLPIFLNAVELPDHKFMAFCTDITERKKIEEKQRTSEQRYRRLFETAQDGILILDYNTEKIIDANKFILELTGYSLDETVGKQLWELGFINDRKLAEEAFSQLGTKGYVRYEDIPLRRKNGETISVEFISNSYLVNGTKIVQCNIRDIIERKRTEKSLSVAAHKLILLSSITRHDIKNQLTILEGNLALFKNEKLDHDSDERLRKVETAAQRISAMIKFTKEYEDIGVHAAVWQDVRTLVSTAIKDVQLGNIRVVNDVPDGS